LQHCTSSTAATTTTLTIIVAVAAAVDAMSDNHQVSLSKVSHPVCVRYQIAKAMQIRAASYKLFALLACVVCGELEIEEGTDLLSGWLVGLWEGNMHDGFPFIVL
jgi:hypothetical protein